MEQADDAVELSREETVLPSALAVRLIIKVGEPYGTSRTTYGRPVSMAMAVADGYEVLRAQVKKKMEQFRDIVWPIGRPIMLKPNQNASQANYEVLAEDDMAMVAQLTRLWGRAAKRKHGAFQVELFVYVQRKGQTTAIRRATADRVVTATAQIDAHLSAQTEPAHVGPAARAYWAIHQARQPVDTPVQTPTTNTFSQLQYIDQQQELINEREHRPNSEFVSVRCRLNGGVIMLDLHLQDLRARLELPPHSLVAPFRQSAEPADPLENIEDIDHAEEDTGAF